MNKKAANKIVEEVIGKCETEEEKEYMEKFWKEIEERERQKKELVEKTDYIKWLENFTKEHPSFSDDTWLYRQDEISKEDYANVCKISRFFSAIERYADKNYISGIPYCRGQYYSIEYNGKVYEIGTIIGQGAVSFCNTEDVDKEATVIKFEELANPSGATRVRTALIENQLKRINDLFNNLVNNKNLNIPIEAIIARSEKVLTELKKKRN